MIKKTLYFGNPAYLSLRNAQLVIKLPEVEKAPLPEAMKRESEVTKPIEDIGVVMLDNKQITITSGALEALIENNCAVITCDSKKHAGRIAASVVWQHDPKRAFPTATGCHRAIEEAALATDYQGKNRKSGIGVAGLCRWYSELHACLGFRGEKRGFGQHGSPRGGFLLEGVVCPYRRFFRDRDGVPPNNLLNYGYAILRAVVARALVGSGLLPTLGIHHHNRYNAYCLADDIMEPYRPYVDELVFRLADGSEGDCELTKDLKAQLLTIPTLDVKIGGKRSPLMVAVGQTTASLYKCFAGEIRKIAYPER